MNLTILCVDDVEKDLKSMKALIEHFNCTSIMANSMAEAKEIVSSGQKIDAVLSDFDMPGGDGLELARDLKDLAPGIPVVVLTRRTEVMKDPNFNFVYKAIFKEGDYFTGLESILYDIKGELDSKTISA